MRRNLNHTLRRMCKDAELLGHANISITYDIYIGIKEEEKEAAIEATFNKKKG